MSDDSEEQSAETQGGTEESKIELEVCVADHVKITEEDKKKYSVNCRHKRIEAPGGEQD